MKRMIKKIMCLILVLMINISTLAAVVSDNDGSAFITKSEVDSLKNDFKSELETYYSTIDSKISDAIASYLAGASAGKTTKYTQDMGVFDTPLKIYMNFGDKSDTSIRSQWRPKQNWRLMFGWNSAYATDWITACTNTYQPKQWYNLELQDPVAGWECVGGYKKIQTECNYLVWAGTDTSASAGSTSKSNWGYIVAANGALSESWSAEKTDTSNYEYKTLRIGDWTWLSDNTDAPTLNGITGANDMSSSGTNMSITKVSGSDAATAKARLTNSTWYTGWSNILGKSQQTTKETNKIDSIPSKGSDWVHVLYNGAVKYSISDEYIGYGAVNGASASLFATSNQMRTFARDVSQSDRGPYGLCLAPFSIINEGYNATTTTIDFSDWKNTSLVKAEHIWQRFAEGTGNNQDLKAGISDGFYLLTTKDAGTAEIVLNVSYTGDVPYVIVNTRPIPEYELLTDMEGNGFKKITGGNTTVPALNDYMKYLNNDKETKIKVEGIEKGKPVFIKILWNKDSTDYVTLKEPISIDYTAK